MSKISSFTRKLPIGAEPTETGTHVRVWAPKCSEVEVAVESNGDIDLYTLTNEEDGYFSCLIETMRAGDLYRFKLNKQKSLYPDPASRFQPDGPEGPSQVINPSIFKWKDSDWKGPQRINTVIYEMHIGTFTQEGTWAAAIDKVPLLAELGITCIELMPVTEFPGKFNWGYDGVNLFAPTQNYGTPDQFRSFVDCAHSLGIAVILDVVYNHFGPSGNYIQEFSSTFFSKKKTDWVAR